MLLHKSVYVPLSTYLDSWFGSLPFALLEEIFDEDIVGYNSDETERRLAEVRSIWSNFSLDDKIEIHDEYFEAAESWTSHLEIPYIQTPSGNVTIAPTSSFHPYDLYGSDTGDYGKNL